MSLHHEGGGAALAASAVVLAIAIAQGSASTAPARASADASPVDGVRLPAGYRDWTLISVAQENGSNDDIRAILGNDAAVKAFRRNVRPFPDGVVIVRLAWRYQSSPRNDAVFPAPQSFVAGRPTNVQVSVKDSRRYFDSGGWGYGQFEAGRASRDEALVRSCFACHAKLGRSADFVFTDYAR